MAGLMDIRAERKKLEDKGGEDESGNQEIY